MTIRQQYPAAMGAVLGIVYRGIAALVPRPRVHLTRYHGVFAPHSRLRAAIIPAHPARPGRGRWICTEGRPR